MKKLFIAFLFFIIHSMLNSFDFNTIIKTGALIASNGYILDSLQNIKHINHFKEIIHTSDPLNNKSAYKTEFDVILNKYKAHDKGISFYLDPSRPNDSLHLETWNNNIFINSSVAKVLADPTFSEYSNKVTHVLIGHEIKHALNHKSVYDTVKFNELTTVASTIALNATFNGILASDMHPIVKYGSISTLVAGKYLLDKTSWRFFARQQEKDADKYAAKHTTNPQHLIAINKHLHNVAKTNNSIHAHFFATHPPQSQRIAVFQQALDKLLQVD